jgi:hypothetical protein
MSRTFLFGCLFSIVCVAGHAQTVITANGSAPSAQGWTISTTGSGAGEFGNANPSGNNGGGTSIVTGPPAWGIYANTSSTIFADYSTGTINSGGYVSIELDNSNLPNGKQVGVQFFSGGSTGTLVFEYLYTGFNPEGNFWEYLDSGGGNQGGSTGFSYDGFEFRLDNDGAGNYSFTDGTTNLTGTLAGSATTFDTIRIIDTGTQTSPGDDTVFNKLTIQIPEPSSFALMALGLGGLYFLRRKS